MRQYKVYSMVFLIVATVMNTVYAAENKEYLQYQEPAAPTYSWLSTMSYIFSLLLTFALVIGLAYFASRLLGKKMGGISSGGSTKVWSVISLGQNRGIYIVEIAGQILALGVTEHSVNVIKEITDPGEIQKIKAEQHQDTAKQFDKVFQRQLASLQHFSQKFPTVFDAYKPGKQGQEDEKR